MSDSAAVFLYGPFEELPQFESKGKGQRYDSLGSIFASVATF
jgi:hypothetical protein